MHVGAMEVEDDMVIFDLFKAERCSEIAPGRKAEPRKERKPVSDAAIGIPPFSRLRPQFTDVVSKAQAR